MTDEFETIATWLISADGTEIPAEFHIWEAAPEDDQKVKVSVIFAQTEVTRMDDECFSALQSIRIELERTGLKISCYGGSKNVYPSGMSLNMGIGDNAYKLRLGQQASTRDLVSIFDTGPDVIPATVAEQKAFFEQWKQSL